MNYPLRHPARTTDATPTAPTGGNPPLRPATDFEARAYEERIEPIVDVERIRQLVLFPFGAARRRRSLALGLFVSVSAAAVLAAIFLPRTYYVESRILARRNMVMPALGNPRRTVPTESDAPTRLAAEAVMGRESLIGIIDSTKLLDTWPRLLSPLGKIRQSVTDAISGPPTRNEQVDGLIGMLERRMWVAANEGNEGTVSIGIVWRDPESALSIVKAAERTFLERRYASEVTLIKESIDILERYVGTAHDEINRSMGELRQIPGVRRSEPAIPAVLATGRPSARSRAAAEKELQLRATLTERRNRIGELESGRNQRLATSQARLAELQSMLGAAHPEVTSVQKSIALLQTDAPELVSLRQQEKELVAQLTALGASSAADDASVDPMLQRMAWERMARGSSDSLEDPRLTYARSRLKIATTNYEEMLDRLEGARIELETARAAFKYRYTVTAPPQFPKRPRSPNVPLILVGGVVLAGLLALFVVTALDIAGGKFVEAWQVERSLGLRVLGQVRAP